MPVEEMWVDRTFMAFVCDPPDRQALVCARQLMAVCIQGATPISWAQADALAGSKNKDILKQFQELKASVADELKCAEAINHDRPSKTRPAPAQNLGPSDAVGGVAGKSGTPPPRR
jgi:hypothetical protein